MDSGNGNGLTDEALIRKFREEKDERAFETLFERHAADLEARIRHVLPPAVRRRVSVADVLQEARITAFARCPEFEPRVEGGPRGWLLRIAELKARAAFRRHAGTAKRAAGREVPHGGRRNTSSFAALGPSPSEAASAREQRDAALRALEALPPDYREVLRLTRMEGLSLAEAAELMGRTREAVKKLSGRAMVRFTSVFEAQNGGRHG
jgi:RNA polymerase sigma-70 factor (ECF subfamily)